MEALYKETGSSHIFEHLPTMYDLDQRFRMMDKFDGLMQVLTISLPAVESLRNQRKAVDLAKLANDGMAELVLKYPDRFAAAVACLPMNDMNVALAEVDRAIVDLKFRGVQIFTPTEDKPLDSPEFWPLYEKMWQYNLPIWIHPQRTASYPDYRSEKTSKYLLFTMIGWPYESTAAMIRLTFSGILEKYPGLKFIIHHAGAMVPFFAKRITMPPDFNEIVLRDDIKGNLKRPVADYLRMFYVDTAIWGNTPALVCTHAFFGAEHMLFGTDFPYDSQAGLRFTRDTIESIDQMDISDAEKKMIFEDNARSLLRLPV
jgi:predicted TIM-barrel fold metal-dependent hydrolase